MIRKLQLPKWNPQHDVKGGPLRFAERALFFLGEGAVQISLDDRKPYPPGDLAMWIFILAELTVFGIFFCAYAFTRMNNPELFNQFQLTLNRDAALINTVALLTSSYFVVRSLASIRQGESADCARWLWWGLAMGAIFVAVKGYEYVDHFSHGISLSTNSFYMFYLSLTFFHFMHVILGMLVLAAVALKAGRGGYSADDHVGVETGGSYWHMVDMVWLVLFPLVYVMR